MRRWLSPHWRLQRRGTPKCVPGRASRLIQQLGRLGACVADCVRDAGVEIGRLARGEDEVLVAECEAEPARDDVKPFMALVSALVWLGARASGPAGDAIRACGP